MSFDYPLVLLGCLIIVPLALYSRFSAQRKRIRRTLPRNLRQRLFLSRLFFRLFFIFGVIALAGPRWGSGEAAGEYRRMVDTVIALDVSRSMGVVDGYNAEGGSLTRMERGVSIVRDTIAALPGMRFAAAVSRNRGVVAIPLTWDNGAVFAFLDAILASDGGVATGRGTNLESLVDAAAGAFQASYPAARVMLLVSDGESLSGALRDAVDRCKHSGIVIAAIALGSDEGGLVPGSGETFSYRDSAAMRMAAGQTGGLYLDGDREDASRALAAWLRSLGPEAETKGGVKEPRARWFVFVILAIIAFGASNASLLRIRKEK